MQDEAFSLNLALKYVRSS